MYDEETEELSDDVIAATGKVADLTKVASNGYSGVSLWADAAQTQYRSLKDYLRDIAAIWDEIDAKSQTQLLEKLFGKRGASVGSAILGNFDQIDKAMLAMENAAGSADREMDIIRDSIDFKINDLKQTWVGFLQDLIDRGDLGKLIDNLTKLSETLIKIIEIDPQAFVNLSLLFAGLYKFKPEGGWIKYLSELPDTFERIKNSSGNLFNTLSNIFSTANGANEVAESIENIGDAADSATDLLDDLYQSTRDLIDISRAEGAFAPFEREITDTDRTIERIQSLDGVFGELPDAIPEIESVADAIDDIGDSAESSVEVWYEALQNIGDIEPPKTALEILSEAYNNGDIIFDQLEEAQQTALEKLSKAAAQGENPFARLTEEERNILEELSDAYDNGDIIFRPLVDSADDAAEAIEEAFEYNLDDPFDLMSAVQSGSETIDTLGEAAENAAPEIAGLSTALGGAGEAAGISAGAIAGIAAAVVAVAAVIGVSIYKIHQANVELQKSAIELGNQFKSSESDIDNYKSKIEELHETIHDETKSYEDRKDARKQLITIQDELIEKYGHEANSIGMITDAINGEITALDRLSRVEWKRTQKEFNEQNLPGWDWANRKIHGAANNTELMLSEMENKTIQIDFSGKVDRSFIESLQNLYGGSIEFFTDQYSDDVLGSYSLSGNLDEIQDKLLQIQDAAENIDLSPEFITNLENVIDNNDKLLESYKNYYDQYVLYERILGSSFEDNYTSYLDAVDKYQESLLSEDKIKQNEALDTLRSEYDNVFNEVMSSSLNQQTKDSILNFFESISPVISLQLDKERLEASLQNVVNGETVASSLSKNIAKFDSKEQLFYFETMKDEAPESLRNAYAAIEVIAANAHMSVKELYEYLVETNNLSTRLYSQQAVNASRSLAGRYTSDTSDYNDVYNHTISILNKLSEEEQLTWIEAANSVNNYKDAVEAGNQAVIEFRKSNQAAADAASAAFNKTTRDITNVTNNLSEFMDALKDVYQDVENGEDFDFSRLGSDKGLGKLVEELPELKDVWADFISAVSESPNEMSENVQDAVNKLVTEFITLKGDIGSIDEENKKVIASTLQMMGVQNSEQVVASQLAKAEINQVLALNSLDRAIEERNIIERESVDVGQDLVDSHGNVSAAVRDKISAVLEDANTSTIAKVAYFDLALAELKFNNQTLDVSQKVAALQQLASAAFGAGSAYASAFNTKVQEYGDKLEAVQASTSLSPENKKKMVNSLTNKLNEASDEALKKYAEHAAETYADIDFPSKSNGSGGGGGGGKDAAEEQEDIMAKLSSQLDEIQEKYKSLTEIMEHYNETGKITVDEAQAILQSDFRYLALLGDENTALAVNEQGFVDLAKAKLNEMQIQLARNALNTINSLQTEADAVKYLSNQYLELGANVTGAVGALKAAVDMKMKAGGAMAEAAQTIWQGYQNAAAMLEHVDFSKEGMGATSDKTGDENDRNNGDEEEEFLQELILYC